MGSPPDLFVFYYKKKYSLKGSSIIKNIILHRERTMKEKAWKNVIAVLIIALALMAGGINVSAASGITIRQSKVYQNNKVYTGWFSQNNGKYYSVKGIRERDGRKFRINIIILTRNSKHHESHCRFKNDWILYVDKTEYEVTTEKKSVRQLLLSWQGSLKNKQICLLNVLEPVFPYTA